MPADITDVSISTEPGEITLHWEVPEDSATIRYIKVSYYDPALKKDVMKTASVYSNSMLIPDTRAKYGEYTFNLQTVSPSGDGGAVHEVKITSKPAPVSYAATQLVLKDLSTNAQEPSEGPISNLTDGNLSNYFHTRWADPIPPAPHWFQANMGQKITDRYKFFYGNRSNSNNKPIDFDLMGSTDGQNWFLIKNFTKDTDNLNIDSGGTWNSEIYEADKPFSYIRFVVNETNSNTVFFTISEFRFYSVTLIDPEASDTED